MPTTRPTTYKPARARKARALCANGLTGRVLAAEFGVSRSTIFRWRAAFPEFAEATALGKAVANERVERALYERAIGYAEEAVRVFMPDQTSICRIARFQIRILSRAS